MADRPIIFSASMVRALLAGRKTQTRRVLKLPTRTSGKDAHVIYDHPKMGGWEATISGGGGCFTIARDGSRVPCPERVAIWHRTCGICIEAPYQVGDRLWVREAHAGGVPGLSNVVYRAGHEEDRSSGPRVDIRWRPSIHMARWVSRMTLTVTDVRVQRLQDISASDAVSEGLMPAPGGWWSGAEGQAGPTPRSAYAVLWNSLHGAGAWDTNPWVAALAFIVHHANIDVLSAQEVALA